MSTFFNRDSMWFGTIDSGTGQSNMRWIETPQTGADVSSTGMTAEAGLMNGGAYVRNSWDSHKTYQFSWGESASPQLASALQGYRNGSFGRGLIQFLDPMNYGTNLLPKRWADPSMAANYEAESLWFGQSPRTSPTGASPLDLPATSAIYDLEALGSPENPDGVDIGAALALPVPPGFSVGFGWVGESTSSSAGIIVGATGLTLSSGAGVAPPIDESSRQVINMTGVAGSRGGIITMALANLSDAVESVRLEAMTLRVAPPGEVLDTSGPWMSGQGHSGCRFVGNPTIVNYNGVGGGQRGVSCILREVGAWA